MTIVEALLDVVEALSGIVEALYWLTRLVVAKVEDTHALGLADYGAFPANGRPLRPS